MRIVRLSDIADQRAAIAAIDAIFFAASGVQTFADAPAKSAFRQRWLGLYLTDWPQHVHVAIGPDGALAGYLVGCPVDPARDPRFAEIGYFQTFASQCAAFPAHLHINLVPAARSQGLGGRLISAFAGDVARAGLPGLHIVTGQSARNVGFYQQQGFVLIAQAPWRTSTVVFMGRPV